MCSRPSLSGGLTVDEAAAWRPHGSAVAAAPATVDPITTRKGDEMSSALAEMEMTLERWTAEPSRTTVEFEVGHVWGLHTVRGRFRSFEGAYVVGPGGPAIELTIDAASVETGCAARDKHLRSADFFGAEEHPQVRFTSTRLTGLGSGRARVTGELEAAGKRVPLAFDVSVRLVDGDLELEATTTVDQSRFGISDGPLRNVRRPTTLRVKTRLVRVPSGFDGGRGGSGRVRLAATRETSRP
jgi:polyisoprenoid-binding protein YceI